MYHLYFRTVSPFLALTESSKPTYLTIPAGTVIETDDELPWRGLVKIKLPGRSLLAFSRDIQERTEQLHRLLPAAS
jgi:hypothetical protein